MGCAAGPDETECRPPHRPVEVRQQRVFEPVAIGTGAEDFAVFNYERVDASCRGSFGVDPVDQRNHRRLVRYGEVDSREIFPGEPYKLRQLFESDVPSPVGGAESARFEGGILHAGRAAVGDGIADYHVFYHNFYRSVLDFG